MLLIVYAGVGVVVHGGISDGVGGFDGGGVGDWVLGHCWCWWYW